MTDLDVNVTGLSRNINAKPNKGGTTVLAYFDCEARGFELRGCAFVRTNRNGLTVWPPKIETPDAMRRAVAINDHSLRAQMTLAAQDAYRAMGGTDGEWMKRDEDDLERRERNQTEANERIARKVERTVTHISRGDEGDGRAGLDTFLKGADGG